MSKFDYAVKRYGVGTAELKAWCEKNKDTHFIPDRFLRAYGIPVEADPEPLVVAGNKVAGGVEDLLRYAEEPEPTPEPKQYTEPAPRARRAKRLVPLLPPITPASQWANDTIRKK